MVSSGSWFPIYRMQTVSFRIWVLLSLASTFTASRLTEHKVHNIVLYPDKHSWCKTTEIKQIVAYPGCSSIEIDNNVCVGACFSYSIPKTIPSAPGEVIIPYCDSCQPVEYEWREVTLTCSDESEEEEGQTEMTKRVQVITNCSCTSCEKQYGEEKKMSGHQKHAGNGSSGSGSSGSGGNISGDDVPELMSLMMGVHQAGSEEKDSEEEEEAAEDVNFEVAVPHEKTLENQVTPTDDKENLIDEEDDEDEKRLAAKLDKESRTLEILHLNNHNGSSNRGNDLIEIAKSEHKHYEIGPHHSLVVKPDEVEKPSADVRDHHNHHHHHHQHNHRESGKDGEDVEEKPSLLGNQFKIHDHEEYLDQIALESVHKEIEDHKIMSVPDMIYNSSLKNEKWRNGVRKLEVPHHHLQPAVEGVELSYFGKSETKDGKLNDEE